MKTQFLSWVLVVAVIVAVVFVAAGTGGVAWPRPGPAGTSSGAWGPWGRTPSRTSPADKL